jgi:hypothetical protein
MGAFALISLITTLAGTATAAVGQIQAGKAAKGAEKLAASQAQSEAARERTRQIRQARTRRAEILQAGANSGAESTSVTTGAAGAMAAGFQNIAEINSQEAGAIGMSRQRQKGINAQGISSLGQGIAAMGATAFNNADEVSDIFGISTKPVRR